MGSMARASKDTGMKAELICQLEQDKQRLQAEVDALRLTLGGRTFSADVPEPVGCPLPGACAQVAAIQRMRTLLGRVLDCWYNYRIDDTEGMRKLEADIRKEIGRE